MNNSIHPQSTTIICNGKFHHFSQAKALQDFSLLSYVISTYPYSVARTYGIDRSKYISLWYFEIVKRLFRYFFNCEPPFALYSKLFNLVSIFFVYLRGHDGNYLLQAGYCLELIKFIKSKYKNSKIILDRASLHTDKDLELRILAQHQAGSLLSVHRMINYDLFQTRERQEYALADKIMVPSSFVKNSFLEKSPSAFKCFVNPFPPIPLKTNVVDLPDQLNVSDFNVLFVGQKSSRKGFHSLVRAVEFLNSEGYSINLVAIGASVDLKSINSPWLISIAPLSNSKLAGFYKYSDVFCLPSYAEGLPLVLCEAAAYGLYVIATANTGVEDLLPQSCFDLVDDPGDYKSIAALILNRYLFSQYSSKFIGEHANNVNSFTSLSNKSWHEYMACFEEEFNLILL